MDSAMADKTEKKSLYLVDGSGFIFRAFHALPPITRPDGTPVGAVMGFCNMLLRLLDEAGDDYVAVIFDAARKNFRNDIYPEYKANRGETPEDLVPQFSLIKEATEAFGIKAVELEGYEADDLIATYARVAQEQDIPVKVVSSDKDLMQLIRPGVSLFDPIKFVDIGLDQVEKKFGVTPDKVIDVQALAGDSTDNVPGVPGIGVKTAALLINEYGDLETLLERAGEIKQNKRRENLIEFADMARISKRLVLLADDAPLPVPMDELNNLVYDHDVLISFLQEQAFRTLTSRVEKKFGGTNKPYASMIDTSKKQEINKVYKKTVYELVNNETALTQWVQAIQDKGVVAVDTETNSLSPVSAKMVGISLSLGEGSGCYIPVGHEIQEHDGFDFDGEGGDNQKEVKQLPLQKVMDALKPVLEDPSILKIGQNIKYDTQVFAQHNIEVYPVDDTMVLSYVLDGAKTSHGMDALAKAYFDHDTIKYKEIVGTGKKQKTLDQLHPDDVRDYAGEDAEITYRLHEVLKPRLAQEKMTSIYERLDRPLISIIAKMESRGIKVDPLILKEMSADFAKGLEEYQKKVFDQAGQEFNLASPKQMGEVLFDNMGLTGGKKTKTGAWSTDAKTLEELSAQGHTIIDDILAWRQLAKLKSTYTDALQNQIDTKTGRVHTSFALTATSTGRLASSDPNLQNIPIRTEEGRKIRTAFIADKGNKLVCIDYSQVELRLVAEMAGIERLKQAFRDGIDIHTMTASEVFGIPIDEMTSERRRAAKAINFGIIYGISGFGLARQLGVDNATAADYIKRYMARFPELETFMEETKDFAKSHGYVETLYGRRCWVPDIASSNYPRRAFAERQAINAPIQGTAADIMKRAMINVDRVLGASGLQAKMLLQIHDELIFEVLEKDVDATIALVKKEMESVIKMDVPLVAEAGVGDNWDEAH